MSRRWRGVRVRRAKYFDPPFSAPLVPPQTLRPARMVPKALPRPRNVRFSPIPPAATLPALPAPVLRPRTRKTALRPARGRFFAVPAPAQAAQSGQTAIFEPGSAFTRWNVAEPLDRWETGEPISRWRVETP